MSRPDMPTILEQRWQETRGMELVQDEEMRQLVLFLFDPSYVRLKITTILHFILADFGRQAEPYTRFVTGVLTYISLQFSAIWRSYVTSSTHHIMHRLSHAKIASNSIRAYKEEWPLQIRFIFKLFTLSELMWAFLGIYLLSKFILRIRSHMLSP